MALISCPECGRDVSDQAAACPNCAYPIEARKSDGEVKIRINTPILLAKIRVIDVKKNEDICLTRNGEVIRLNLKEPITIQFKANGWGGLKLGEPVVIDPKVSKKYELKEVPGAFMQRYVVREVDFIDSD